MTIFILIAILLVGIGIAFFVFKGSLNIGKPSVEIEPIQTQIQSCLESTTEDGISYIALQGGYYEVPEQISMNYSTEKVPYYYIDSKKNIPSVGKVNIELGNYIKFYLRDCINLSSFEEQGFDIKEGNLSVSVDIIEGKINVKAVYPLAITKGESTSRLSEFKVNINSNAKKLLSVSEEIVNLYNENPDFVCLNCLDDISNKYSVEAKATPMQDKNVIWFSILDKKSSLNWRFVVEQ